MKTNRQRGSAILVVLILMVVLGVAGAALLISSHQSVSTAKYGETSVGLSNCAMAVRQHISGLAKAGAPLTTLNFVVPASGTPISLQGGHYDLIQVTNFTLPSGPQFGVAMTGGIVQNLANALPMTIGSASTKRSGSAVCTDSMGRTFEVEFTYVSG